MTGYRRSPWIRKILIKSATLYAAAVLVLILITPLTGWLLADYPSLLIWLFPAALLFTTLDNDFFGGSGSGSAGSGGWDGNGGGGDGGGGE